MTSTADEVSCVALGQLVPTEVHAFHTALAERLEDGGELLCAPLPRPRLRHFERHVDLSFLRVPIPVRKLGHVPRVNDIVQLHEAE